MRITLRHWSQEMIIDEYGVCNELGCCRFFDSIYQSISYVRMGQTIWIIHIDPVKDSRSPKCVASSHGFCLYFLLTKKMPCLIRNNHKFGERNTSCCVTSWEVQTIWTCLKTARLSRRRNKKTENTGFLGTHFSSTKVGGKTDYIFGIRAVPGVPGFWLGDWEQFQSLPGKFRSNSSRRKWKSHLPGDLELLDRNGFWWTKHPHRYLNVGQIITGRDLRHVKIAET